MIPKVEFKANHKSPNERVLTILSRYFLTAGSKIDVLRKLTTNAIPDCSAIPDYLVKEPY